MLRRLINLFRPQSVADEIREELEFHRSQTSGSFGNVTSIQERTHEASTIVWLETLWQDARIAVRLLRRTPALSGIALLSIALSVGATAVVFAAIKAVLLNPLPYSRVGELVQLRSDDNLAGPSQSDWVSWPDTEEIARRTRTLASVGVYGNAVFDLGGGPATPPEALYGLHVTASLFPTLGVSPMIGRNILPEEDQLGHANEMILSYGLWKRRFNGNKNVVGKTVRVNGRDCLVIGVMPADFDFPLHRQVTRSPTPYVQFWAPMRITPISPEGAFGAVARLRPGVSLAEAQQDLASINATLVREFPKTNRGRTLRLAPLWDRLVGRARSGLWFLMAAAAMFLLIGCANVANLLLARGFARQREIAVRMAIGAGRLRIVRQLLTESCLLALLGGLGGYLFTLAAWKILPAVAPVSIPRLAAARADWTVLVFALAVALLNGILFGIAPALRSARGQRGAAVGRRDGLRASLVMAEIAITVVLVLVGGQLLASFVRVMETDPGFEAKRVLASVVLPAHERYKTPEQRATVYRKFLEAVRAIPGVESAGTVDALPFSGENHGGFIDLGSKGQLVSEIDVVGGDYLQTLGVRLEAGRWFREDEMKEGNKSAIINDALARRLWPHGNALGRQICVCSAEQPNNWKRVIGVVSGVRHADLDAGPGFSMYLAGGALEEAAFLVVKTDRPAGEMEAAIRRAVAGVDPDQPVLLSASLQGLIDDSLSARRFILNLLAVTAGLALLLSAAGVYGVTLYTTSRRTQEIGLRMALGATPGRVQAMVFRQGFLSVAAGLAIGLALAAMLMRTLRGVLAGLADANLLSFWIAAGLVSLIAATACWLPARRATRIDPMSALRQD